MPKDILAELQAAAATNYEYDAAIEMQEFSDQPKQTDKIFDDIEEVRELLIELESHVEDVKSKYRTMILSANLDKNLNHELDDIMSNVKRIASNLKNKLTFLDQNLEENKDNRFKAEYRIPKIQHCTLTRKYVEIMTQYNTIQIDYRDKCKESMKRQVKISGKNLEDEDLEEMLENGNVSVFTEGILLDTQAAKQQLADIKERHADIVKLEKSIKELYDLFFDMANLVSEQGYWVENIEKNVENTFDYVEEAKKELKEGEDIKWRAQKKKAFLLVALILFLTIVLLIIFK